MKLAIFDKDGTLVSPKSGEQFVQHPKDQKLLPGVAKGLETMSSEGWHFAIASNQGAGLQRPVPWVRVYPWASMDDSSQAAD
jgi:histidinol phosphatase-like enzyme